MAQDTRSTHYTCECGSGNFTCSDCGRSDFVFPLPEEPATPFNGHPLIASAPTKNGGFVIVVKYGDESVVAEARTLTDREWSNGHYCPELDTAMRDFASRIASGYRELPLANPEVQAVTDTWNANRKTT